MGIQPADCQYSIAVSLECLCTSCCGQIPNFDCFVVTAACKGVGIKPADCEYTVGVSFKRVLHGESLLGKGRKGGSGGRGLGFPPGLKVAFHGFWDKKDSKILALDFPARPLHKRAPHRDGQTSSFILLNSFPRVLSSYLHSSFSSTSSAPPGTSASNAWLRAFQTCDRSASWQALSRSKCPTPSALLDQSCCRSRTSAGLPVA